MKTKMRFIETLVFCAFILPGPGWNHLSAEEVTVAPDLTNELMQLQMKTATLQQKAAEVANRSAINVQPTPTAALIGPARTTRSVGNSWRSGTSNGPQIIPQKEVDTETLLQLHEDLSVMTRILDGRGIGRAQPEYQNPYTNWYYNDAQHNYLNNLFDVPLYSPSSSRLHCTYLEGYGLLFNGKVPMLLYPTQEAVEPKPEPNRDAVWEAALQEIRNPGDNRRKNRSGRDRQEKKAPAYNEEAYLALQRSLMESLKHAKNIRHQEGIRRITLRIVGFESILIMHVDFNKVLAYANEELDQETYWAAFEIIRYGVQKQTVTNNQGVERNVEFLFSDPPSLEQPAASVPVQR